MHATHVPPPVPQAASVLPAAQVLLFWQQPEAQLLAVHWHVPLTQVRPPVQVTPQLPQFVFVFSATQVPPQQPWPEPQTVPPQHAPLATHTLPQHSGVAPEQHVPCCPVPQGVEPAGQHRAAAPWPLPGIQIRVLSQHWFPSQEWPNGRGALLQGRAWASA